ncbi:uncharacterized protein LOC143637655 isoform X2 [Bidens hawaiensis]|uniref:uncharacterized protein LOC143637655 isoform X2 n=1 Tax=Bidens hawaiensis TaxID=980011 RepID=UPI00404A56D7
MRFKKGCKAEVMNKEVQKAWCVADKGEKVSKRGVKPSPPAIGSQNFVAGDVVEVFDEGIWKVATVSKILKEGRFLVRPHGFAYEIKAHKTNIRPRQSWGDGQRVPVGKISGSKRSSPFCSSFLDAKKVKRAEKDGGQGQSQRRVSGHSSQKSHNWRHASLASKGTKQDSGSAAFIWKKQWGISAFICYR